MNTIKVIVEQGDDEVEKEFTLPLYFQESGQGSCGKEEVFGVILPGRIIQISKLSYMSSSPNAYIVYSEVYTDIKETHFTGYFTNPGNGTQKKFEQAKAEAAQWLQSQQEVLANS